MLDIRSLREDPQAIADQLKLKGFDFDVARFQALEDERSKLQQQTETLQAERNAKSKSIGKAKSEGIDIAPLVAEVGDLGDRLSEAKAGFETVQSELNALLSGVPNLPDASVPAGADEDANVELRRWGNLPEFNFEPRDHVDLGQADMDFDAAAKISGSRYVVMHGATARL
ncbi:MAG: serine--tRNA ligase, partial [Pseudomonadales bacterium]